MRQMNIGIPGYEDEDPEEQEREMYRLFNEVFRTSSGRKVLNIILDDLHFMRPCSSMEQTALANYAKALITDRLGIKNFLNMTDAIIACGHE